MPMPEIVKVRFKAVSSRVNGAHGSTAIMRRCR